jgi:hypothetical protein
VTPVIATLSRPAAVEVVDDLARTGAWREVIGARRRLDPRLRALPRAPVGEERRLSQAQTWYAPGGFRAAYGLSR